MTVEENLERGSRFPNNANSLCELKKKRRWFHVVQAANNSPNFRRCGGDSKYRIGITGNGRPDVDHAAQTGTNRYTSRILARTR